ncbi:MAG: hypothetical protein CMP21_04150 [Rickettsiales bacterium]|nr:hypothetical protein [Rickettsiales bacterium]|tara:strand:- start:2606 stop:3004 length:399 start_codon:yes stop_codon:yes gene_type:complete
MNRRYKIKNFLNEDVEQVDEIFWGKKRKSKYHDDDDYVETDDKEVYADDLISFDKNRIKKITSAISAYVRRYTTNSKDKEDTVELLFKPTVRSSLEDVKKQLSKLKNVLKIKSIQVLHSLIIITLKNQHKYS